MERWAEPYGAGGWGAVLVPSRGGAEGRGQTAGSWWGEGARPLADQPNGEGEVGGHGKERRLVFFFFNSGGTHLSI